MISGFPKPLPTGWSKRVSPQQPQVDETNEREFVLGDGQPGKGFEPLVVVALFLRVVRHSAFVLAGRPTNILADYNFA